MLCLENVLCYKILVFFFATSISKIRQSFILRQVSPLQEKELTLKMCFVWSLLGAVSFVTTAIFQCSHPIRNLDLIFCFLDITSEKPTVPIFLDIVLKLQLNPNQRKAAYSKACFFIGLWLTPRSLNQYLLTRYGDSIVASASAQLCYIWRSAKDSNYAIATLPVVICSQTPALSHHARLHLYCLPLSCPTPV